MNILGYHKPTQHDPQDPWSRTSFSVGQSGHCCLGSNEAGKLSSTPITCRRFDGFLLDLTTPHNSFAWLNGISLKFKAAWYSFKICMKVQRSIRFEFQ